jgi:phosphonate transport system substrate-binding protein
MFEDDAIISFQNALLEMGQTIEGEEALRALQLDGFTLADPSLFDGIARRMRILGNAG